MCVVAAELRLFLLHTAAELSCVLYAMCHTMKKKCPEKLYYQILLRVSIMLCYEA